METTEMLTTTDVNPTTDVNHKTETTTIATREPQPPYASNGEANEAKPSSGTLPAEKSGSRPVTAATARRRRLWEKGTLVLEDPFGAYRVTEITDGWVARTEPNDPELEPQALELFPGRTLTFAPSSGSSDHCEKCGAKHAEAPGSARSEEHITFDEIDTKHALWHVRSALGDAECIKGRPILKMGIERDLRRAERILAEHAKRNGLTGA